MYRLVAWVSKLCAGRPIRSRYGIWLSCRPNDLTFQYAVLGEYGDMREVLENALSPADCFIDIGANQGVFTILASELVEPGGMVLSFEPSRREFIDLLRNLDFNQAENVVPFHCGVSDTSCLGNLCVNTEGHSGRTHYGETSGALSLQLDLRDIQSMITGLAANRTIVVKIDVEGYEARVLRSLGGLFREDAVKIVIVEIDERLLQVQGAHAAELYAYMAGYGFSASKGVGYATHYDELFIRSAPGRPA